jgi:hypothetical protein
MEGLLNNKERIWKEAVVAYFELLSRILLGGTKEKHKNSISVAGLRTRDLNPGPPSYKYVLPN